MANGSWWVVLIPFKFPVRLFEVNGNVLEPEMEMEWVVLGPWGVGGGEVPNLLRSFLVMGGRE